MDENGSQWVIAQTKPNGHRIAEENLQRQGFVTYLPMIEETRRSGTHFVKRKAPVFPGYIFIKKEADRMRWRSINSTKGITKLVSIGPAPAEVPSLLISELHSRFDNGVDRPSHDLGKGDAVRVGTGPFTDLLGTIERVEPRNRIWVLLEVLGRTTRVSMQTGDVRKTGR